MYPQRIGEIQQRMFLRVMYPHQGVLLVDRHQRESYSSEIRVLNWEVKTLVQMTVSV